MGKQITLTELRHIARTKALLYRSCEYVLSKRGWDRIWPHLSVQDRVLLYSLVRGCKVDALKEWVHDHPHLELGEKSVARLRDIARDLGIKNYSRLSKHRLISAINKNIEVEP